VQFAIEELSLIIVTAQQRAHVPLGMLEYHRMRLRSWKGLHHD